LQIRSEKAQKEASKGKSKMNLIFVGLALYAVLSLFSMATMSIGAGALAILIIVQIAKGTDEAGAGSPSSKTKQLLLFPTIREYLWSSSAIIIACVMSLVFGSLDPLSFGGYHSEIHLIADSSKLWYFFWPLVLVFAFSKISETQRLQVLRVWLATFVALSIFGIVQHFIGWPRPMPVPGTENRFLTTLFLGHHLSTASIFIFPFFVLLDFLRQTPKSQGDSVKFKILPAWVLAIGAVAGFLTLMLTYSRTLWVALPLGILVWMLWTLPKPGRTGNRVRVFLILGVLIAGGLCSQLPSVKARLNLQMGIHEREDLWEANIEMFKQRPLAGVGLKHNQELSGFYLMEKYHATDVFSGHAHNNVLDFLAGTGVIGLITFLIWCFFPFKWTLRPGVHVSGYNLSAGFFCALLVFQLNGLTQVNFWEAKVEHQLMWSVAWILWGAISS
jgi:O-antigen ligase